jgi:membrane peptidoglycan carboxypeptidase
MKKSITNLAIITIVGIGLAGAGLASAHGLFGPGPESLTPEEAASRQQTMFEKKAEVLGLSVDEVKQAWAEGKTLPELAEEHNINEEELKNRLQNMHQQRLTERLSTLVEQGVITQNQADQKLQTMAENMGDRSSQASPRGFGHGRHKGFELH